MSQKTKKQLQQELKELSSEKEQLLQTKKANEKAFTKEQQARLNKVTEDIVDLEEQIELAPADETPKTATAVKYEVPKGTEKLVHVKLSTGNRFDPKTGKEINKPVPQMFNYGEWELFKKNYKLLGYTITEVMNDPFKDATPLIGK
jgi:ElaB/YqjD/DUF883 family membrane-anchored ribosome-binding protein